jgi:hypothetical protein
MYALQWLHAVLTHVGTAILAYSLATLAGEYLGRVSLHCLGRQASVSAGPLKVFCQVLLLNMPPKRRPEPLPAQGRISVWFKRQAVASDVPLAGANLGTNSGTQKSNTDVTNEHVDTGDSESMEASATEGGGDNAAQNSGGHKTGKPVFVKKIQPHWLKVYPWLKYNEEKNIMWCQTCRDTQTKNNMALGIKPEL